MITCTYCDRPLKTTEVVQDHFIPRTIISGKKVILIDSCCSCNRKKRNYLFWSIDAVRDYIQFKNTFPSRTYKNWFAKQMEKHSFRVEDIFLLSIIFDRKVPDFSFFTNKRHKRITK